MHDAPDHLLAEQEALLVEIDAAFGAVTRVGGVSWTGAETLDAHHTMEFALSVAANDPDQSWRELINDVNWRVDAGWGGWLFLDPIGFRYYLPAAMVRCVLSGIDEGILDSLTLKSYWYEEPATIEWRLKKWSALDNRQRLCIKRFLVYMSNMAFEANDGPAWDEWQQALSVYWATVE